MGVVIQVKSKIFFDHVDFQEIEINGVDKIVAREPRFIYAFKFVDVVIEPDRGRQVERMAYFVQGGKYFLRSGFAGRAVFHHEITDHFIVLKFFCP